MVGIEYGATKTKTKMNQNKLAKKRHNKKLKRKHKKYTGPKYSNLEQLLMWATFMDRAGIQLLGEPEDSIELPQRGLTTIVHRDGTQSTTSFSQ